MVLEAHIKKIDMGILHTNYSIPSLDVLMSPKVANAGCLAVKFSYKGDFLAVSFNNERGPNDIK